MSPDAPRSHRRPRRAGHERWMVSYADFITLLFAFFATLYAMSRVDAEKFHTVAAGVQHAFTGSSTTRDVGVAPHAGSRPGVSAPTLRAASSSPGSRNARLAIVMADLEQRLARERSRGLVGLSRDPRGVVVSIREAGVFDVGSARVLPPLRRVLHEVSSAVAPIRNALRVEGHTDDRPIRNARYGSNWELSAARATAVVAVLVEQEGLDAARLSAAGYAEHHPREANDTEAHRAANRRVDIVVLAPDLESIEEPRIPDAR